MDLDALFAEKEKQYGLPPGYLKRTRQIESSDGKNVYNANSRAAGDFQFIPKTARAYGLTNPYDINQSADAAARLARDNRNYLQSRGIENPTGAQLYLAHQQGAGGAVKLLNGGDAPAARLVGEKAVNWNGGDSAVTGPQFAQRIQSKFDHATKGGGYAYSAAGGLNSPRENIAMANAASAAPSPDNRALDDQPTDGTAIGDAPPGLLDRLTNGNMTGVQGLLGQVQKHQANETAAANAQTQMLWQMAAKGAGSTQPKTPFMGFQKNIFGNGLLG